ncbi:hypothetical protein DKY63_10225 [Pseudomonas putida]|uniref:Uncharacterized protein n=1 Tax=Pseudomonas putida TaxID=303 RepID=A0A2Z4RGW1_PSEPU|nr:hypothetical protein DKY63_10225 [Pseudomonas putida]
MLAMVVNDNAGILIPRGVLASIASMLAPTVTVTVSIPFGGRCGSPARLNHTCSTRKWRKQDHAP